MLLDHVAASLRNTEIFCKFFSTVQCLAGSCVDDLNQDEWVLSLAPPELSQLKTLFGMGFMSWKISLLNALVFPKYQISVCIKFLPLIFYLTLFPGVEVLWKCKVSAEFWAKICGS